MRAHARTRARAHARTRKRAYAHTRVRAYVRTHIRAHARQSTTIVKVGASGTLQCGVHGPAAPQVNCAHPEYSIICVI